MTNRKLASVTTILDKKSIEGADLIEAVLVHGWWVVAKKGEFTVGDLCFYFEIDSVLPCIEPFEFLRKSSYKKASWLKLGEGYRLKTIKLKGQISQGLVVPFNTLNLACNINLNDIEGSLGVEKWDPPVPSSLRGISKGNFPSFIRKTDEERIQNLATEFDEYVKSGTEFEVTEKLEGSSMTCYIKDGEFGVCSRNINLLESGENAFWEMARKLDIKTKLETLGKNIAVQGELIGPGIQGNIYELREPQFLIFNVYMIDQGYYMEPEDRRVFVQEIGLNHVPVICTNKKLEDFKYIQSVIEFSDGDSHIREETIREGLVYKATKPPFISFKAISNNYLLYQK